MPLTMAMVLKATGAVIPIVGMGSVRHADSLADRYPVKGVASSGHYWAGAGTWLHRCPGRCLRPKIRRATMVDNILRRDADGGPGSSPGGEGHRGVRQH